MIYSYVCIRRKRKAVNEMRERVKRELKKIHKLWWWVLKRLNEIIANKINSFIMSSEDWSRLIRKPNTRKRRRKKKKRKVIKLLEQKINLIHLINSHIFVVALDLDAEYFRLLFMMLMALFMHRMETLRLLIFLFIQYLFISTQINKWPKYNSARKRVVGRSNKQHKQKRKRKKEAKIFSFVNQKF